MSDLHDLLHPKTETSFVDVTLYEVKLRLRNYSSLGVERHSHTTDDCHGLSLSISTVIQDRSSYHITYHAVQDLAVLEKVINRGWALSRDSSLWSCYRKDKIADGVNYAVFK